MVEQSALTRLEIANGISQGYHDIAGNYYPTSEETGRQLLSAMSISADSDTEVAESLTAFEHAVWNRVLPYIQIAYENDPVKVVLTLPVAHRAHLCHWEIETEDNYIHRGAFKPCDIPVLEEHSINGQCLHRLELTLELRLGLGYHWFKMETASGELDNSPMRLIVAPRCCYKPPVLEAGGRVLGISIQLYAVRSQRNWGIGDFTDLKTVIEKMPAFGCASVGLNPLHALYADSPDQASPYSPSSRLFLNPLYMDVEFMDDFHECPDAHYLVRQNKFQMQLDQLRAQSLVDYKAVTELKYSLFKLLYEHFRQQHLNPLSERGSEFRKYQRELNPQLRLYATFEALRAEFHDQSDSSAQQQWWRDWPQEFQQADSESVKCFVRTHETQIEFYEYLQWQTELQLAKAADLAKEKELMLGIYQDLAVGCDGCGADVWTQPHLFAQSTSIGAPPDDFSPAGQDWGLKPAIPNQMKRTGYQSFVDVLRRNMRYADSLRVDHVMGLRRLFWIADKDPVKGTYVDYPMDDLLGIVALESHRQHCLVIGEDLGTVPDDLRWALDDRGVFSYKVFYFEKHWHGDHSYRRPNEYPVNSLVTASTHDLPTIQGFWAESDIRLRDDLGLFGNDDSCRLIFEQRRQDRNRLILALHQEGLWGDTEVPDRAAAPPELSEALHCYLARSNASVMMIQIEDILEVTEQCNLPGTTTEYPNWRRKLPVNLEDWLDDAMVIESVNRISDQREYPQI